MKIFNASPLILLLEELREPNILCEFLQIDSELYVTQSVVKEITSRYSSKKLKELIDKGIIKLYGKEPVEDIKYLKKRFPFLHSGEISVISIARNIKRRECEVVIDEAKARGVADKLGLKKIGCFGLFLKLYNNKIITEEKLKLLCRKIDKSSFHINFKEIGYEWVLK